MNNQLCSLKSLARHLQEPLVFDTSEACSQYKKTLPVFITLELAHQPVDHLYADVADHLDICPDCASEYEEISQMMLDAFFQGE